MRTREGDRVMRFITRFWSAVLSLSAIVVPVTVTGQAPLPIGAVLPLSGPNAQYGSEVRWTLDYSAREGNALAPSPSGTFAVVTRDSKSQPAVAVQVARQLAEEEHISTIATSGSAATSAIASSNAPISVLFSGDADSPDSLGGKPGVLSSYPSIEEQLGVLVDYASTTLKAKHIVVLVANGVAGRPSSVCAALPCQALAVTSQSSGSALLDVAQGLLDSNADAIVLLLPAAQSDPIIGVVRSKAQKVYVLGTDELQQSATAKTAGAIFETRFLDRDDEQLRKFQAAFDQQFPGVSSDRPASFYLATRAVLRAITKSGLQSGPKILDVLKNDQVFHPRVQLNQFNPLDPRHIAASIDGGRCHKC